MKTKSINTAIVLFTELFLSTTLCAQWSATQTFFSSNNHSLHSIEVEPDQTLFMGGVTLSNDINNQNFLVAQADLGLNTVTTFHLNTGNSNNLNSILRLPNGNFAVVGNTIIDQEQQPFWSYDAVLIEVSPNGFPIQYRHWGDVGNNEYFNRAVLDGSQLIVVGGIETTTGTANGELHPIAMAIDTETGLINWAKEYILQGFSGTLVDIIPLNDGFLVVGQMPYSNPGFDVVLMKINSEGNRLWSRKFTSTDSNGDSFLFEGTKCLHIGDGSTITLTSIIQNPGTSSIRMAGVLIKTDGNGNLEWVKNVGLPLGVTAFSNISLGASQDEIILTGGYSPDSFDFAGSFAAKLILNDDNLTVSDIGYFPTEYSIITDAKHFTSNNGNGYVAIGISSLDDYDQSVPFLVRMDENLGSWDNPNCWIDNVPLQVENGEGTMSLAPTSVYNYEPTEHIGAISSTNPVTTSLIDNDSLCLPNQISTSIAEKAPLEKLNLIGYPNPFSEMVTLKLGDKRLSGHIEIYNAHGTRVYEMKVIEPNDVQLNLGHLPTGVYHIRLISNEGTMHTCKILKS